MLKELKGCKVVTNYHTGKDGFKSFVIKEIKDNCHIPYMAGNKPTRTPIGRFFYGAFKVSIKFEMLPIVLTTCGTTVPIECLDIMPSKKAIVAAKDRQNFIQNASVDAPARFKELECIAKMPALKSKQMREFGLELDDKPIELKARVLDPPRITRENGSNVPIVNTRVKYDNFYKAPKDFGPFGIIICSNNRNLDDQNIERFVQKMKIEFDSKYGQNEWKKNYYGHENIFVLRSQIPNASTPFHVFTHAAQMFQKKAASKNKEVKWLMPIIPDGKSGIFGYEQIKGLCELELDILTHCVTAETAIRIDAQKAENIIEKLNSKLGGINYEIPTQVLWEPFEFVSEHGDKVYPCTFLN